MSLPFAEGGWPRSPRCDRILPFPDKMACREVPGWSLCRGRLLVVRELVQYWWC